MPRNGNRSQKGSSQLSSLNNRILQLQRETNPVIRVRSCRANPEPVQSKTVYYDRTVQFRRTATSGSFTLTSSELTQAVFPSATSSQSYRVNGIRIWNATLGGYLTTSLSSSALTTGTPSSVVGSDQGTGSSLGGISYNIPLTISKEILANATVFDIATINTGGSSDSILFQVSLKICYAL
jgi:hypothetical protein